jgi:hypothetical protein
LTAEDDGTSSAYGKFNKENALIDGDNGASALGGEVNRKMRLTADDNKASRVYGKVKKENALID